MTTSTLPLLESVTPGSVDELLETLRDAHARGVAVYPIGGGTALDYGLPATVSGLGVQLTQLNGVIDYPARDMTITVQAGMTMRQLREILGAERQWLPIDVPFPERATLGGVIATNFSGPRRFGQGTMRDYVIGIEAVAADGTLFKAGGRVVKNVAGYDFCKLLTGSLGTLAVITQVTLKLKPLPQSSRLIIGAMESLAQLEPRLAALNLSPVTPTAIELCCGPYWQSSAPTGSVPCVPSASAASLGVLLEGTEAEVAWMEEQLRSDWQSAGLASPRVVRGTDVAAWVDTWAAYPADTGHALVVKASILPSKLAEFVDWVRRDAPDCSALAHAGDGLVWLAFPKLPAKGLSHTVVREIGPRAIAAGGHAVVAANPSGSEMTHQAVWGGASSPFGIMSEVKRAWDPLDRLNPGRFVYQW